MFINACEMTAHLSELAPLAGLFASSRELLSSRTSIILKVLLTQLRSQSDVKILFY